MSLCLPSSLPPFLSPFPSPFLTLSLSPHSLFISLTLHLFHLLWLSLLLPFHLAPRPLSPFLVPPLLYSHIHALPSPPPALQQDVHAL